MNIAVLMRAITPMTSGQTNPEQVPPEPPIDPAVVQRLEQAERLLLSGELMVSLSHEVNNVLQGILGNIQLLQHEDLPDQAQDIVRQVMFSGHQLQSLMHSMLGLAKTPRVTQTNIAEVLEATIRLIEPLARDCRVVVELSAPDHLELPMLPQIVQHIILNLVVNSIQAMCGSGGKISIATDITDSHIEITVRDSGPGIPEAIVNDIFNPFFSTKPPNIGTGLGLAIARNLARQADGDITVIDTRPGQTTFCVQLPLI